MMDEQKEDVLEEISFLINVDGTQTELNPAILQFMDLKDLQSIRDNLRAKKEEGIAPHAEWLQQFKK
jgi:hypothetical protein